jgi:protease IV
MRDKSRPKPRFWAAWTRPTVLSAEVRSKLCREMKRALSFGIRGVVGLLGMLLCLDTQAQVYGFERPTTLPAFGRDAASNHDTTAATTNPALLGFLPGAELRWSSVYLDDRATVPWQGHALAFGFPIPFLDVGTALRLDFVNPPTGTMGLPKYQVLTFGMGVKTSSTSALGFSYQHYYSESRWLHGLDSWSLGWAARPWNVVGVGVSGRNLNAPSNSYGWALDPAWDFALSFRPFSTDAVELGLVAGYVFPRDADDYFMPRASLGLHIPSFGQIRGDIAVVDRPERRDWIASAGVAFDFNGPDGSLEGRVTSIVGSGLGDDAKYRPARNLGFDIAIRSFRDSTGIELPHFGVLIRLEETPSARKHVALLRQLWAIAEREPAVDAVVFELRAAPSEGTARAQELRDAIAYLRANGKKVACHIDDAGGGALYVCSAADRIFVHPAGGIRFMGFSSTQFYVKGLLDKLGVRADIVRIGEHKSAPEMFTREGPTEVARADRQALMRSVEQQWLRGVGEGRQLSPSNVASKVGKGPFVSSEAKLAGFVDDYAYSDEINERVARLVGRRIRLVESPSTRAPNEYGSHRRVAIVYVEGDMVNGKSQAIPLVGMRMAGAVTLAETFKHLREDPRVGAVVLRIESPGGSALAADTLWRELQLLASVKPVVTSMGSVAASGGYYIASATHRIFANPATITGSIGVFAGKADVAQLLSKIGVNTDTVRTTSRADGNSIFRPYTAEERAVLGQKVAQYYALFLSRVSIGRSMKQEDVDRVGQGRVFTGEQAMTHHLVDELGGLRQAIAYAQRVAELPATAPIVELPPPDGSLLTQLLGLDASRAAASVPALPEQLAEMARALVPFVVYESDRPLMRLEETLSIP